ncbi:MAG: hypothetical protein JST67_06290 [Bacteroidetes bacterium]|nr:hypothetical protein [Bacteroidota bacterium]
MRKKFYILLVCTLSFFVSCKKNDEATIPYGTTKNYSSVLNGTPPGASNVFSFTKIIISPNPVKIGIASKITAVATGTNLKFVWTTTHGDLFGAGNVIYYSDSCIGTYSITCVVSDGAHSVTITVPITISN